MMYDGRRSAARRAKQLLAGAGVGAAIESYPTPGLVSLTYDDGPDPVGTRAVLEALREYDARATFFVLLTRVRRHPEVLQETLADGHEIALHGLDHTHLATISPMEVRRRTLAAFAELEDTLQQPVRWFRPPYMGLSPGGWLALPRRARPYAGALTTVWDWETMTTEERLRRFRGQLAPGAMVLAHDAFAGPLDGADDGPEPQLDRGLLTHAMLEELQRRGLRSVSVGELSRSGQPTKVYGLNH